MTGFVKSRTHQPGRLRRWLPALAVFLLVGIVPVSDTLAERVITSNRVYTYVNVREAPSTRSDIIGTFWSNEDADLLESTPGWYRIKLINDLEGYVSSHWTLVVEGAPFCRKEHDPACRK